MLDSKILAEFVNDMRFGWHQVTTPLDSLLNDKVTVLKSLKQVHAMDLILVFTLPYLQFSISMRRYIPMRLTQFFWWVSMISIDEMNLHQANDGKISCCRIRTSCEIGQK